MPIYRPTSEKLLHKRSVYESYDLDSLFKIINSEEGDNYDFYDIRIKYIFETVGGVNSAKVLYELELYSDERAILHYK